MPGLMCGRLSQNLDPERLQSLFDLPAKCEAEPRWNIAPGSTLLGVRERGGHRELVPLRWGLIPPWAKTQDIGLKTFNARAESVADKPSFAGAFRTRRCLIPADGFYEWEQRSGRKLPWLIRRRDGNPLALAGLWERWQPAGAEPVESCTIITCPANRLLARIHHRMPVVLERESWRDWLNPTVSVSEEVLRPAAEELLEMLPLDPVVNSASVDGPDCQRPRGENQLPLF
ncbi:MAG: SOS response-associated peptidase [Deltaproteobacteria bacterium]|nr:MAG: SOS response-associated peptidase [Deltaproteobacteria bacterium]